MPAGVRLEHPPGLLGEARPRALRRAAEADRTQEAVAFDELLAQDLGEPSGADPPLEFHLPESVLRVDVSEAEERVGRRGRADRRHAAGVALDLDARGEPVHGALAGGRRKGGDGDEPQREEEGAREDEEGEERLPQRGGSAASMRNGPSESKASFSMPFLPRPSLT